MFHIFTVFHIFTWIGIPAAGNPAAGIVPVLKVPVPVLLAKMVFGCTTCPVHRGNYICKLCVCKYTLLCIYSLYLVAVVLRLVRWFKWFFISVYLCLKCRDCYFVFLLCRKMVWTCSLANEKFIYTAIFSNTFIYIFNDILRKRLIHTWFVN